MKLSRIEMAQLIDHTNLKPNATSSDIDKLCREAAKYRFHSVCINPCHTALASRILSGQKVKVCTVIGFPLGANTLRIKMLEAESALADGSDELDVVINIGMLIERRYDDVKREISAIVDKARQSALATAEKRIVKVIIGAEYLEDSEKMQACRIAAQAGAQFVKNSTGFGGVKCSARDITLIRKTVGETMGVKAAGGIRSTAAALEMIGAGASRIGSSSGVDIIEGMP